MSARVSRDAAPRSTVKRAPVIRAPASKSRMPSASPTSQCGRGANAKLGLSPQVWSDRVVGLAGAVGHRRVRRVRDVAAAAGGSTSVSSSAQLGLAALICRRQRLQLVARGGELGDFLSSLAIALVGGVALGAQRVELALQLAAPLVELRFHASTDRGNIAAAAKHVVHSGWVQHGDILNRMIKGVGAVSLPRLNRAGKPGVQSAVNVARSLACRSSGASVRPRQRSAIATLLERFRARRARARSTSWSAATSAASGGSPAATSSSDADAADVTQQAFVRAFRAARRRSAAPRPCAAGSTGSRSTARSTTPRPPPRASRRDRRRRADRARPRRRRATRSPTRHAAPAARAIASCRPSSGSCSSCACSTICRSTRSPSSPSAPRTRPR